MTAAETPPLARIDCPSEDDPLIQWMLGLSPVERLQVLQGFVDSISELHGDQSAAVQRRA